MEQDERQRRLEAAQAKLDHFRQRRVKSDSLGLQKKITKRSTNVQMNEGTSELKAPEVTLRPPALEYSLPEQSFDPGIINATDQAKETGDPDKEMVPCTGKEHLKQLQYAVEKRNKIISQLSVNLQTALETKDQVQQEALQLTDQIQCLQKQLQKIKEYSCQVSLKNQVSHVDQVCLDDTWQMLLADLEDECENRCQARDHADHLQQPVQNMEAELADKVELSMERAWLDGLVQDLRNQLSEREENACRLRSNYEADISNYELRLQMLEEERRMDMAQLAEMHEADLQRLQEQHNEEVRRIRQILTKIQCTNFSNFSIKEKLCLDASSSQDNDSNQMECYLPSADPINSSWASEIGDRQSQLETSEQFRLEIKTLCVESGMLSYREFSSDLTKKDFPVEDTESLHSELSKSHSIHASASKDLILDTEAVNLGKELLFPECQDLSELEERNRQLEVLQEKEKLKFEEEELFHISCTVDQAINLDGEGDCDVQTVFVQQCSALENQRDQLLEQLEEQQERNQSTSTLLGQKTLEVDSVYKELHQVSCEMEKRDKKIETLEKDKAALELKVLCLKNSLTHLKESTYKEATEKAALEQCIKALHDQVKSMENILASELQNFEHQLHTKESELERLKGEWEKADKEYMEKEIFLEKELAAVRQTIQDHVNEHKEQLQSLLRKEEIESAQLKSAHQEEIVRLEQEHQNELSELNEQIDERLTSLRADLEEEHRKQLCLVKEVNEREHRRAMALLVAQKKKELEQLSEELFEKSIEEAPKAELLQAQTQHNLELEALRLSLTNLHTAQMELLQVSMQKDKEAALLELKTALREKLSQESAMLQTRHHFELERLRDQSREQAERTQHKHQQAIEELRIECAKHISEHRSFVEQETKVIKLSQHPSAREQTVLQARMEDAQTNLTESQAELNCKVEENLNQASNDHKSTARKVKKLQDSHIPNQQLHDKETFQVEKLEAVVKVSSIEEVDQLETMRASRKELAELKGHLLVHSTWKDDVGKLKKEFAQQRQDLQEQNEHELENLRTFFQQWLQSIEESRREEIALLQLRLVEDTLEESVLKTGNASQCEMLEARNIMKKHISKSEPEKIMEKHKMELSIPTNSEAELTTRHMTLGLQETNKVEQEAMKVQLESRHMQEKDYLEARMMDIQHVNMDVLENTFLKRFQMIWDEKEATLLELKATLEEEHASKIEQLQLEHHSVTENLRRDLAQVHMDEFNAMTADLIQAHQEELSAALSQQKGTHCSALAALKQQVLDLETQHTAALLELRDLRRTEKLQLQEENEKWLMWEEKSCNSEEQERPRQQKDQTYREQVEQLTLQLQELDSVVTQLRTEMCDLQRQLEGKSCEMATLEGLLQRRERENQESSNLLAMLRDDLSTSSQQRQTLIEAHGHLQQVILAMLKITMATEELISARVGICPKDPVSQSKTVENQLPTPKSMPALRETDCSPETAGCVSDSSLWSMSEDVDLSQKLCESLFCGPELDPQNEELVLRVCSRLHSAVKELLERLLEAQSLHYFGEHLRQGGDTTQLLVHQSELLEKLDQETGLKKQLELELHKASGLLEGYVCEKASLEECFGQKEVQELRLVQELESLQLQLQELQEQNSLLLRQRDTLTGTLEERDNCLLKERQQLVQESLDVQRQAEKERGLLVCRIHLLESTLEEQENHTQELEEVHRTETEDLQQQITALEKQLKHNRQFIDEQAVEREHERDEFQQEIKNLEVQLKLSAKGHSTGDMTCQRVESLQALIKNKMEDYSTLLQAKEQCQRDVDERDDEIDKMAGRICELEQALMISTGAVSVPTQQEMQRVHRQQQELMQDKEALQQQLYADKLQISALQSKLDESRHWFSDKASDQSFQEQLNLTQQELQKKEEQVELLLEQVHEMQSDLSRRGEEVQQLSQQVELLSWEHNSKKEQLQLELIELQETVNTLRGQHQQCDHMEYVHSQLPAALLQDKNQEIDHLNQQILRMQQELHTFKDNCAVEEKQAEVENLSNQLEALRCDQQRLKQDQEQEVEQLHEVIHKLQAELAHHGPDCHKPSSQGDCEGEGGTSWTTGPISVMEESLCLELTRYNMQSSLQHQELQHELEQAAMEKQALQKLLLSQEKEYGTQVEVLGSCLTEEKQRLSQQQGEVRELCGLLEERQNKVEHLEVCLQELEDRLSHCEDTLLKLKLQVKAAEQERHEAHQDLLSMTVEKDRLESLVLMLQLEVEESHTAAEHLRSNVTLLEMKLQTGSSEIATLETRGGQFVELKVKQLQEKNELLKQEVTSKNLLIQDLKSQLEEKVLRHEEAQKDVLTCAEETLAKAESAIREKARQLSQLSVEHDALKLELAAVKEGLSSSAERADKLQEEGQSKDHALADLVVHNSRLKAELCGLQDNLVVQEQELACQQRELEHLRQRCSIQDLECSLTPKEPPQCLGFQESMSHDLSLCSPELLRKPDLSDDHSRLFHTSRLSDLSGLHNSHLESLPKRAASPESGPPSTRSLGSICSSDIHSMVDSLECNKLRELDTLELTLTPSHFICSPSPGSEPEWTSDGYGSNMSPNLGMRLKLELENTERLDAQFVEYLRCRGIAPTNADSAAGSMYYSEQLSPELQTLLKRMYQESCRLLSLSRRSAPSGQMGSDPSPPPSWQQERQALQETVLSLRSLLCRMADCQPKMDRDCNDWTMELLQAVKGLLENERSWLHAQLQSLFYHAPQHHSPLTHLETLLQEQTEQLTCSLEQLICANWCNQQSEVQRLQEQLQELQTSLKTAHVQSAQLQQHLQRDVEELQMVSQELQIQLQLERSQGEEHHSKLQAEKDKYSKLRLQLDETHLQLENVSSTLEGLHHELSSYRQKLEDKCAECQACEEAVHRKQTRVQELEDQLQQLEHTLQEQASQLGLLNVSLDQEQLQNSNLRSELQIERSRCDTLVSHERECTQQALLQLDEERARCSRLSGTLVQLSHNHAQRLEEEARRLQAATAHDRKCIAELQGQLQKERAHAQEMGVKVEQLQMSSLQEQKHQEEEQLQKQMRSDGIRETAEQNDVFCLRNILRMTKADHVSEPSHPKMQRLYEKYLRAESFRKSLVYQKRYLLLLLGGFQECEHVTLALIARMGGRPSSLDPQAASPRPRPLNRFRTWVRVVIAISRLKFLTKKWNRIVRKRTEIQKSENSVQIFNSATMRDPTAQLTAARISVKSPFILQNRMHTSPMSTSREADCSLTDYIQHLEKIQQRLEVINPGSMLLLSCPKKADR
ncbi:pericentrin isoform X3 [Denticeps clupeoides]|uniref:pericentrin isoform X3 n=1 Tax=Denticeps clupeoides TaxID=299321 RepID=UPI0010A36090|nr:A-kinase anchor protein 9-like isoform X3 [Denticeps clupeoides]